MLVECYTSFGQKRYNIPKSFSYNNEGDDYFWEKLLI